MRSTLFLTSIPFPLNYHGNLFFPSDRYFLFSEPKAVGTVKKKKKSMLGKRGIVGKFKLTSWDIWKCHREIMFLMISFSLLISNSSHSYIYLWFLSSDICSFARPSSLSSRSVFLQHCPSWQESLKKSEWAQHGFQEVNQA